MREISPGVPPYGSRGGGGGGYDFKLNRDGRGVAGSVASRQIIPTSLPTNSRVEMTKTTTDNTKKSRKGKSWSLRLDKQTNNEITHNRVGCGELTSMVTV